MSDLFEREFQVSRAGGYTSPTASFPYAAGFKGEAETGKEAAEAINKQLGRLQRLVLDAVTSRGPLGLTPEEACDLLDLPRTSLQPRFSELKAKGKVVDSGMRRANPSSRKRAVVWCLPAFKAEASNA
ncbi:MAG: hypothetical protein U5M50_11100 [Sphingobium sp.]|nr:hypothetical protein [Sphingobium sp.]